MRSGIGTKSGEPGLVTFSTKVMMDCFAGPSFHDGNGSAASETVVVNASTPMSAVTKRFGLNVVLSRPSIVNLSNEGFSQKNVGDAR